MSQNNLQPQVTLRVSGTLTVNGELVETYNADVTVTGDAELVAPTAEALSSTLLDAATEFLLDNLTEYLGDEDDDDEAENEDLLILAPLGRSVTAQFELDETLGNDIQVAVRSDTPVTIAVTESFDEEPLQDAEPSAEDVPVPEEDDLVFITPHNRELGIEVEETEGDSTDIQITVRSGVPVNLIVKEDSVENDEDEDDETTEASAEGVPTAETPAQPPTTDELIDAYRHVQ